MRRLRRRRRKGGEREKREGDRYSWIYLSGKLEVLEFSDLLLVGSLHIHRANTVGVRLRYCVSRF